MKKEIKLELVDDSACYYARAVVERLNLEIDGLGTVIPTGRCGMFYLLMSGLLQQQLEWLNIRSRKRNTHEGNITMGELYRFFGDFFSTPYQSFDRGTLTPSSSTRVKHARDGGVSLPHDTALCI